MGCWLLQQQRAVLKARPNNTAPTSQPLCPKWCVCRWPPAGGQAAKVWTKVCAWSLPALRACAAAAGWHSQALAFPGHPRTIHATNHAQPITYTPACTRAHVEKSQTVPAGGGGGGGGGGAALCTATAGGARPEAPASPLPVAAAAPLGTAAPGAAPASASAGSAKGEAGTAADGGSGLCGRRPFPLTAVISLSAAASATESGSAARCSMASALAVKEAAALPALLASLAAEP